MAHLLCRLHDIGPDEISLIARKAANVFLILTLLTAFLTPAETAFAQGGGPEDPAIGAAGKMLHAETYVTKGTPH